MQGGFAHGASPPLVTRAGGVSGSLSIPRDVTMTTPSGDVLRGGGGGSSRRKSTNAVAVGLEGTGSSRPSRHHGTRLVAHGEDRLHHINQRNRFVRP